MKSFLSLARLGKFPALTSYNLRRFGYGPTAHIENVGVGALSRSANKPVTFDLHTVHSRFFSFYEMQMLQPLKRLHKSLSAA